RALALVEGGDDQRAICFAVADVALAEEQAERHAESERWRHRQLDACSKAGDRIFTANARYGIGKMRAELGHPEEALGWAREALAEFEAAGRPAGVRGARVLVARSLIETARELDHADGLVADAPDYYRGPGGAGAVPGTEALAAAQPQ